MIALIIILILGIAGLAFLGFYQKSQITNLEEELKKKESPQAHATYITPIIDEPTNDQLEYNRQLVERSRRAVDEARSQADKEIANQQNRIATEKLRTEQQLNALKDQLADSKRRQFLLYDSECKQFNEWAEESRDEAQMMLEKLTSEIDDARAKQESINKEIQHRREREEQQDYYRIVIPDASKADIELLNSVRQKLTKPTILDKIIYDNYIAKPVKEMIKRVLKGKDVCGIYKITNINTGEAYVGKSVHVGDRWQNHIKSAHGLDGVADSMFQRALKRYGDDCWTFEVIEEDPKEILGSREKVWIDYYGTKQYGFNEKSGG